MWCSEGPLYLFILAGSDLNAYIPSLPRTFSFLSFTHALKLIINKGFLVKFLATDILFAWIDSVSMRMSRLEE